MDLTYPEVGATSSGELPAGYHHLHERQVLGAVDLDEVATVLMTWQMHRRAGVRPVGELAAATPGQDVTFRFAGQTIPCRVVSVVDEADRRGFTYGTLPGHPECGEERFELLRDPATGVVTATITAFSRPATRIARLLGPVGVVVQTWMARRYLAALAR